jgi:prophage regulatory protein
MSKPDIDPTRLRYKRAPQQLALRIEESLAAPAPPPAPPPTADIVHVLATPAFFRMRDVLRITALSRPTLYRRIAAGRFPAPVHLGGRACAWSHGALQAWVADPEGYRSQPVDELPIRRRPGRPRRHAA